MSTTVDVLSIRKDTIEKDSQTMMVKRTKERIADLGFRVGCVDRFLSCEVRYLGGTKTRTGPARDLGFVISTLILRFLRYDDT